MDLLFRSGASIIIRNKTDEGKLEIYEDHFIFLGKLYAINGKVDTNYLNYNKTTISKGFVFTSSGQSVLHISFSNMQSIDIIRMDQNKEEELIQLIDGYHSKKEKIENGEKGPKEGNAAVSQGQETVAKLTAQQLKALEMKKRLQEAEKRRQTIEEENKRIEEEERKRKEEEERRQREEAERKRKEEEERKRREEEELKRRLEEERKRKEEEERKRREEAEKRRLEKLKQREERIATAVTNAKEKAVDLSGKIDQQNRDAISLIIGNPLYLLGILSFSTKKDANDSLDKFKKLARLKSEKAFKPLCVISGLPAPDRDVSILQSAMVELKNKTHYFLWFAAPEPGIAWHDTTYCSELLKDGVENASYDLFLANYLNALVTDSDIKNEKLWEDIFTFVIYIINGRKKETILVDCNI